MSNPNFSRKKSIKIDLPELPVNKGHNQTLEISQQAIKAGFLNNFPDKTFSIFIYLITHMDNNNSTFINPATVTEYLPYKLKEIIEALNQLEKKEIIDIIKNKDNNETKNGFNLKINLDEISFSLLENQNNENKSEELNSESDNKNNNINNNDQKLTSENIENQSQSKDNKSDPNSSDNTHNQNLKKMIIQKNEVSKNELKNVLQSFIPSSKSQEKINQKIDKWLEDFNLPVLQELLRRVAKWQKNTDTPDDKAYFYLKAIIDDWYEKEIFEYEQLQDFDQLYRETKELAETYGINKWKNVKTVQMQTFRNWLTEDFALSLSVAKYAIKEAIKRKKDGQPSLKYIEDNFITPFKKEEIKSMEKAKKYLKTKNSNQKNSKKVDKHNTENQSESMEDWNNFEWNLDKIS